MGFRAPLKPSRVLAKREEEGKGKTEYPASLPPCGRVHFTELFLSWGENWFEELTAESERRRERKRKSVTVCAPEIELQMEH